MKSFVTSQVEQVKPGTYTVETNDSQNGRPNKVLIVPHNHEGFPPNVPVNMNKVASFYKDEIQEKYKLEFPAIRFRNENSATFVTWFYAPKDELKRDADFEFIKSLFVTPCPSNVSKK